MAFWNKVKDGAVKTWDAARTGASGALDYASEKSEEAMASLAKNGKFSKDDFCKAFVAAGVLMAVADDQIDQAEVDKIAVRVNLHPILKNIRESKRTEMLETAVAMAQEGMLGELSGDLARLVDPLYDGNDLKYGQDSPECTEIEQKARSIFQMATAIKDADTEVTDGEVEMLEAIVFWLERQPAAYGMREDLGDHPPAIVQNIQNG
jgi:tellurite resistance protein